MKGILMNPTKVIVALAIIAIVVGAGLLSSPPVHAAGDGQTTNPVSVTANYGAVSATDRDEHVIAIDGEYGVWQYVLNVEGKTHLGDLYYSGFFEVVDVSDGGSDCDIRVRGAHVHHTLMDDGVSIIDKVDHRVLVSHKGGNWQIGIHGCSDGPVEIRITLKRLP